MLSLVTEHADEGERTNGHEADHVRVWCHLPPLHGRPITACTHSWLTLYQLS